MASERKELDLVEIIKEFSAWVGKILKNIGMGFLEFIRFSFQNLKILIPVFVVGMIAAVTLSSVDKTYKSDMVLQLNVSNSYNVIELTKSLDAGLVSENSLGERLNIADSIADAITSIKGHFVIDMFNNNTPDWVDYKDKFEEKGTTHVRMLDRINITVKTKDLYSFPVIQQGLVYFYVNDEVLKAENELRFKQQLEALDIITRQIARLEKLSDTEYFKEPAYRTLTLDSQALVLGEKPKQLYHREIEKLNAQKDSLQIIMELQGDAVTVVKPFTVTKTPVRSLLKMIVYCGFIAILLGYIIAVIVQYRKQIWDFLNEKK